MQARSIRWLSGVVALLVALPILAERGDDSERSSKNGMTKGAIGGVEVAVEFGRPNVKGRTIWGDLVPYGEVWRTGADEATTITFGGDVMIEGRKLAAGTYALFTIPGESEWTFIFNKVAKQWGAFKHDKAEDALRVSVTPSAAADHVESMAFVIDGSSVVLRWEKLAVGFEVGAG